jgi:hypothetical protein
MAWTGKTLQGTHGLKLGEEMNFSTECSVAASSLSR